MRPPPWTTSSGEGELGGSSWGRVLLVVVAAGGLHEAPSA